MDAKRFDAASAVDAIHDGTAIYTSQVEIDSLLEQIGWPMEGATLLDPGCGDGNMLVAAMAMLAPQPGDVATAALIHGMDLHGPSVELARARLADLLTLSGWSREDACETAAACVEHRDYLLDAPDGRWDVILANPPYWRRTNLPEAYREAFDEAVPKHARGDLLHAYLHTMLRNLSPEGVMALVTSDRWLLNSGAGDTRREIGAALKVESIRRLDTRSAFHRPKERVKGTPPRVHAVAMVLSDRGRTMDATPFRIEEIPEVDGVPLRDLVELRLAPWLGADDIFLVGPDSGLPAELLVPCVEPATLCPATDGLRPTRRWAIVTGDEMPPDSVLEHLDRNLHRMPKRGRRKVRWLPPERFDGRLPLGHDAVLVPRLAQRLRAVRLPAGMLPLNHSLVLVSGLDVPTIQRMLGDPRVQAQADALALRVEDGYRSYTTTLLRQLVIPHDLIEEERIAA